MNRAVRTHECGGPDGLRWDEVPVRLPGLTLTAQRTDLLTSAGAQFGVVGSGAVMILFERISPLTEAAPAPRELKSRRTTGSIVSLPS